MKCPKCNTGYKCLIRTKTREIVWCVAGEITKLKGGKHETDSNRNSKTSEQAPR